MQVRVYYHVKTQKPWGKNGKLPQNDTAVLIAR